MNSAINVIQLRPLRVSLHVRMPIAADEDDDDDSAAAFQPPPMKMSLDYLSTVVCMCFFFQYPDEPPHIEIVDSKGLDEERKSELVRSVRDKASELTGYLMLVALCEEAVEKLSNLNHPEGDCPLCLYPLNPEDDDDRSLPFMKLMSCFHCFHSECIIRWWNWLQVQNNLNPSKPSNQQETSEEMEGGMGTCPVCRKVFHTKDFEHVLSLSLVGSQMSSLNFADCQIDYEVDDKCLIESEKTRRQKFEEILKKQEENSGLIEPPKDLIVLPGMYLPQQTPSPATTARSTAESAEGQVRNSNYSRNRMRNRTAYREMETSNLSANNPSPSHRRNHGMKNHLPIPSTATNTVMLIAEAAEGRLRNSTNSGNRNRTAPRPGPSHRRNHVVKIRRPLNIQKPGKQQWVQKSGEPSS